MNRVKWIILILVRKTISILSWNILDGSDSHTNGQSVADNPQSSFQVPASGFSCVLMVTDAICMAVAVKPITHSSISMAIWTRRALLIHAVCSRIV